MLSAEELKALDARIRANADKLIAKVQRKVFLPSGRKGGRQLASFDNCIRPEIEHLLYAEDDTWPLWVDDPLSGVARLDWYSANENQRPLSKVKILQCFAQLDTIDVGSVSQLLMVGERQARRYYKACELLHEKLVDNYCDDSIRCLTYPATFIYPKRSECPEPQVNQEED